MNADDTLAWVATVGGRHENHETPEWSRSCDTYVRDLWNFLDDPNAPTMTETQIRARLRALHSARADLLHLVEKARSDRIEGPNKTGSQRSGEWSFPVGEGRTTHPIGELRQPRDGCDVWRLHHRAYFAAPTVWPGSLIWSLAAFKPDQSISDEWSDIQDGHIEDAARSAAAYTTRTENITDVHRRMSP